MTAIEMAMLETHPHVVALRKVQRWEGAMNQKLAELRPPSGLIPPAEFQRLKAEAAMRCGVPQPTTAERYDGIRGEALLRSADRERQKLHAEHLGRGGPNE